MDVFVNLARTFLCVGRKSKALSRSCCVDLAAQLHATDLGLKPAVLYDVNGACPQQLRDYLSALQKECAVSLALTVVVLASNSFIVNRRAMMHHLEAVLKSGVLVLIDVSTSKTQPSVFDIPWASTEDMTRTVTNHFKEEFDKQQNDSILELGEDITSHWNLCTLFGILLGYPATYWFDQDISSDNCLSLVPLLVFKVSITWHCSDGQYQFCLFSFSIPEALYAQVEATVLKWTECLQEQLNNSTAFTDLKVSRMSVTLPAVAL